MIESRILDGFYYGFAAQHKSGLPKQLGCEDVYGGGVSLGDKWCCWYRFFNGGFDLQNRAGRVVILCAFINRKETFGMDASGVLSSEYFTEFGQNVASRCPLPLPNQLTLESQPINASSFGQKLSNALAGQELIWKEAEFLSEAGNVACQMPLNIAWVCKLDGDALSFKMVPPQMTPSTTPHSLVKNALEEARSLQKASVPIIDGSREKDDSVDPLNTWFRLFLYPLVAILLIPAS